MAKVGELLLYLATVDLREFGDNEVRDYLELLLGTALRASREQPDDALEELREQILEQLKTDAPDRKEVAAWVEDHPSLLPPSMADFHQHLESFDGFLESLFENEQMEEDQRLDRFRRCLELLDEDGWQARSEAARGLATLEEELTTYRDAYLREPMTLAQCTGLALVAHINLLEGFDVWQQAFRQVHQARLDEALDAAFEGTCLFHGVELWSSLQRGSKPHALTP